jgi:hypothetical protein
MNIHTPKASFCAHHKQFERSQKKRRVKSIIMPIKLKSEVEKSLFHLPKKTKKRNKEVHMLLDERLQ